MSQNFSIWFILGLAFVVANLPFISQRFLFMIAWGGQKSLFKRLIELVIFYFIVGGVGLALEHQAGQIAPQGWEFYAITATLFITFAFPGFVYRYLLKHKI